MGKQSPSVFFGHLPVGIGCPPTWVMQNIWIENKNNIALKFNGTAGMMWTSHKKYSCPPNLHTVDFKGFYKTCSWTMGILGNTEKSPPLLVSELAWPDPQEPNNLEPSYQETEMLGWVFNTICSRFYQHNAKKKMKNL